MKHDNYDTSDLRAALPALESLLAHRSNITGRDIGFRWKQGKPTNELCLRIHVMRKLRLQDLESTEVIPREFRGHPVDVIEGPYRPSELPRCCSSRDRFPVLMGGISCGRPGGGAGTAGLIVIDKNSQRPALLSNWHVLVGPYGHVCDPIMQPAAGDGGTKRRDIVAELGGSMLGLDGDAALAPLTTSRPWYPTIFGDMRELRGIRDPQLGEILVKSGRTTGVTRARVDGIGVYSLNYLVKPGCFEKREIRGFKLVAMKWSDGTPDAVASAGDSGSGWYSAETNDIVGLHFAGEAEPHPAAEFALACMMTTVSEKLGFRLPTHHDVETHRTEASTDPDNARRAASSAGASDDPLPTLPEPWSCPEKGAMPIMSGPEASKRPQSQAVKRVPKRSQFDLRNATPVIAPNTGSNRNISRDGYIWPNLRHALGTAGVEQADALTCETPLGSITENHTDGFLAKAIGASPAFSEISVWPGSFDQSKDFWDVTSEIARYYEAAGYTVS